ncbi:hypothetical protein BHE74_00030946 [Ensete ventricosum]|nr:hypothetical protein BHE74_00030946 [Ensete ventricosum]
MAHTVRGISTGTAKRHAGTLNSQAFHLESSRNPDGDSRACGGMLFGGSDSFVREGCGFLQKESRVILHQPDQRYCKPRKARDQTEEDESNKCLKEDKVNQTSTTLPSFRVSHPRYQLAIPAYPLVSRLLGPLSDDDDDAGEPDPPTHIKTHDLYSLSFSPFPFLVRATTVSVRLMLHQMACLIDLPAAVQRVF